MGIESNIEWCDDTVNFWWGCAKVHTGCKHCYAEYFSDTRYKNNLWGENALRKKIKSAHSTLSKIQRQAEKENTIRRVFVGSMMDIFEVEKPLENPDNLHQTTADIRNTFFSEITLGRYKNILFLFLTKRPENILQFIPREWVGKMPENVWFGVSASDQITFDHAAEQLTGLMKLTSNIFLSAEPQVARISIPTNTPFSWIIQGGESGNKKRPFDLTWAYEMQKRAQILGIKYFFKQIDKIQEIPEDLRIQEIP
jgi:protein gp37